MSEHRFCNRWQINWQAKIKLEGAEVPAVCPIRNINLKGAQVSLAMKLPKDTFMRLSLVLSDDFILNVEVWVVWQKAIEVRNVYGFYFSKIHDSDKEKIYQFVRRNSPKLIDEQWWEDLTKEKGGEEMQKEKFQDKRVFERFLISLPVKFLDVNSDREGIAKTQDISAKGACLVTGAPLPMHTPLEIWLEIPDKGEPLYIRAETIWSKPHGMGEYRIGINLEKADLMGLSRVLRAR